MEKKKQWKFVVISSVWQMSNFPSFESYRFWNYSSFVIIDAYWFDRSICMTTYMFTYIKKYKKLDRQTILVAKLEDYFRPRLLPFLFHVLLCFQNIRKNGSCSQLDHTCNLERVRRDTLLLANYSKTLRYLGKFSRFFVKIRVMCGEFALEEYISALRRIQFDGTRVSSRST